MSENNEFNSNVYYDLDNNNKDDFVNQERKNEPINIPHYENHNQPQQQENSGYAIAALVCGIISLVSCIFIAGILAIIFYFVDKNNNNGKPNNLARIGMILGIVSIVAFVLFIIIYVGIIAAMIASGAY